MVLKHLANGYSTFFIKGKPVFSNGTRSLPKNPRDCPILHNWVFDDFIILVDIIWVFTDVYILTCFSIIFYSLF